jgi:indolepyruvate ferredoxin oxidoreductase beta subunit
VSGAPTAGGPGRCRLLIVGVGGQGVLTAAGILGEAALLSGVEVAVGQLHGMSQRGGSVQATVVLGGGSSFVEAGQADVVLGFEPLEALRALRSMSARTLVIVSLERVVPFTLAQQGRSYPDLARVLADLEAASGEVVAVDVPALVDGPGARVDRRSLNVALLGVLASRATLPFGGDAIWRAIETRSPPRHLEANRRAFALGRELVTT